MCNGSVVFKTCFADDNCQNTENIEIEGPHEDDYDYFNVTLSLSESSINKFTTIKQMITSKNKNSCVTLSSIETI